MNVGIVYFEDPSFKRILTERGVQVARRWRYLMERTFALYNADIDHRCTLDCFNDQQAGRLKHKIPVTEKDRIRERQRVAKEREGRGEGDTHHVHAIDRRLGLYGCPRSGQIHQCHLDPRYRKHTCTLVYTTDTGAVYCRFSDWEVMEAPLDAGYNRFTDDHMEFKTKLGGSTKIAENIKRAKTIQAERRERAVQEREDFTGRFNAHGMKATTKALRAMVLRSSSASDTELEHSPSPASPKRSRLASSDGAEYPGSSLDEFEPARKRPTPPPSPTLGVRFNQSSSSSSSSSAGNGVHLCDRYSVRPETYNRIKRAIREILFDPTARDDFDESGNKHTIPRSIAHICEGNDEVTKHFDFYVKRVALLYAIVREEQIRAHPNQPAAPIPPSRRSRKPRGRRSRPTNGGERCHKSGLKIEPKKFTTAAIYLLGMGVAAGAESILAPDAKISAATPIGCDLVWYGVESSKRRAYIRNNQSPDSKKSKYKYDSVINQRIQQFVASFERGTETLKRILDGSFS